MVEESTEDLTEKLKETENKLKEARVKKPPVLHMQLLFPGQFDYVVPKLRFHRL